MLLYDVEYTQEVMSLIKGLPEKLRVLRLKNGYSQKQVADQLGVSPSIVSGYETGERTPSAEVLLAISYLYKCSTDYLLGRQVALPNSMLNCDGLTDAQIQAISNLIKTIKGNN